MDKIQGILAVVKKHHFWILCGLAAVVAVVCWYMATGSLAQEFSSGKANVTTQYGKLTTVATKPDHPNENWIKGIDTDSEKLRVKVDGAWKKLYADQKKNVFVAPQWAKWVGDLKTNPTPTEQNKMRTQVEEFRLRFAKEEVPQLAKIVDAEWRPLQGASKGGKKGSVSRVPASIAPAASAATTSDPTTPGAKATVYKVHWNPIEQDRIMETFTWPSPPELTALQVQYAMEELWLYRALCEAIRETNSRSTGPHDAWVKSIQQLLVSHEASEEIEDRNNRSAFVQLPAPETPAAAPASGTDYSRYVPGKSRFTSDDPAFKTKLSSGRYTNSTGKPVTGEELETLRTGEKPLNQYNLMPFHINLVIDQRRLSDLLWALHRSKLPLEVHGVRFGTAALEVNATTAEIVPSEHDKSVEIFGVAYIVRPPEVAKPAEGTESTDATATAPVTPAAP